MTTKPAAASECATAPQSGRADLLFEVGMAEVPARFLPGMVAQLRERCLAALRGARLTWEGAEGFGAPRRVAVLVSGLDRHQPDQEHEVRGPAARVAFGPEGAPTAAALGFARSQGVDPGSLIRQEVAAGNEYVFARKIEYGRPAAELLPELLAGAVRAMQFARNMRWGDYDFEFVRPIRWLLCLYGEQALQVELPGLDPELSRPLGSSRGHRFLAPGPVTVPAPEAYVEVLREAKVVVDPSERLELITAGAAVAAAARGAAELAPKLLDELVWLAEHPVPVLGAFDPEYLDLPEAVLVTVMQHHQRFIPVRRLDETGRLASAFVGIRDGDEEGLVTVRQGYEAVLRARLADARFFFAEDRKRTLDDRLPELEGITYYPKLGSMGAKSRRLAALVGDLARLLGLDGATSLAAAEAARLAKADLTTQMVRELPELQGIMGAEYARLSGASEAVAAALAEQYLPAGEGSRMPATAAGLALALADKLDALLGYYQAGVRPTGSQDPYGLRRAAHGVVEALLAAGRRLDLRQAVAAAAAAYEAENGFDPEELAATAEAVLKLLVARIEAALGELGVSYDEVDAVMAATRPELDPVVMAEMGQAIRRARGEAWLRDAAAAAVRVGGLGAKAAGELGSGDDGPATVPGPDPSLFVEPVEQALYQACLRAGPMRPEGDFASYWRDLAQLRDRVDAYFDGVLVMASQAELRRNRLALCHLAHQVFAAAGDLSRLVWPKEDEPAG